MRIVLDTNIICQDFPMSGSPFRVLFDGLPRADHSLHIPKLVIDETTNKYAERLRDCQRRIEGSLDKARRLSGTEIESPLTDADIDSLVEDYSQMLPSRFAQAGATIMDYPSIPHEEIVKRALNRRKPFSRGDAGYRDALIWENVIDLGARPGQDIGFISANRQDFCDDEGNLHPDLVADMEVRGIQSGRIVLFGSLREFVDEHIKPTMEALEDIRQRIAGGRYPGLDLWKEVAVVVSRLPYAMSDARWDPAKLGFPSTFERLRLAGVSDSEPPHVLDVRELHSGEFLLYVLVPVECEFSVLVSRADYYAMRGRDAPEVPDHDWDRYHVEVRTSRWLDMEVEMTFDPATSEVTSVDFVSIGKKLE